MGLCASNRSPLVCCAPREGPENTDGRRAELAATPLFQVFGFNAYHTSIIIGERELFFDGAGIVEAEAFWSHEWCEGARRRPNRPEIERVKLGCTELEAAQAARILEPFFEQGSYDILRKNCNSFSDAATWLLTRRRLDPKFNRLERWVLALEPLSLDVIRRLLGLDREDRDEDAPTGYMPNPLAEGFDVEEVVAKLSPPTSKSIYARPYCCARNAPVKPKKLCSTSEEGSPNSIMDHALKDATLEKAWEPSVEDYPCSVWNPFDRLQDQGDQEPIVPPVLIERLRSPGVVPARTSSRPQVHLCDEDVVWQSDLD
ncbi:unnamed protein product [Effrenium voratum]|uniref:PPPDE domain-containing protein n=1 Tax=Effrenium voratum TaxID=2562239 RepID=A0AA36J0Z3_9DINO|nr:unnamed protein product [Effrenium voratum]